MFSLWCFFLRFEKRIPIIIQLFNDSIVQLNNPNKQIAQNEKFFNKSLSGYLSKRKTKFTQVSI